MANQDTTASIDDVDLSMVERPSKGFVLYGSTKIERNSKGLNVGMTASVAYHAPDTESPAVSINKWEQVHAEVVRRCWETGEERKLAIEQGNTIPIKQFENDVLSGEKWRA